MDKMKKNYKFNGQRIRKLKTILFRWVPERIQPQINAQIMNCTWTKCEQSNRIWRWFAYQFVDLIFKLDKCVQMRERKLVKCQPIYVKIWRFLFGMCAISSKTHLYGSEFCCKLIVLCIACEPKWFCHKLIWRSHKCHEKNL